MATFTWYGLTTGGSEVPLTEGLGFYSTSVGRIAVGEWNAVTYVASTSGSALTAIRNTTSGSTVLPVSNTAVPLRVRMVEDVSVAVAAVTLRAYALGETVPPDGVTVLAAEASGDYLGTYVSGSSSWAHLSGSGEHYLSLASQTEALTHYFHIAVTVSPTAVGKHIGNVLQLTVEYY